MSSKGDKGVARLVFFGGAPYNSHTIHLYPVYSWTLYDARRLPGCGFAGHPSLQTIAALQERSRRNVRCRKYFITLVAMASTLVAMAGKKLQ